MIKISLTKIGDVLFLLKYEVDEAEALLNVIRHDYKERGATSFDKCKHLYMIRNAIEKEAIREQHSLMADSKEVTE